jgi:hypothetical protein
VHKFGRNDAVPSGAWAAVTQLGTVSFLSAATAVRIKAGGHAADDAAGAGAREIEVVGIDTTLAEVSETIATAGASASAATSAVFWRVYRVTVTSVGTYGAANTDDIVVENAGGGTDLILMSAGEGQSQHGRYSIPTGKTGYLLPVHVTVDSKKAANIRVFTREDLNDASVPVKPKRQRLHWDGIVGAFDFISRSPTLSLPALSDIWMEAWGDGAASEVSVNFELLLVDD